MTSDNVELKCGPLGVVLLESAGGNRVICSLVAYRLEPGKDAPLPTSVRLTLQRVDGTSKDVWFYRDESTE